MKPAVRVHRENSLITSRCFTLPGNKSHGLKPPWREALHIERGALGEEWRGGAGAAGQAATGAGSWRGHAARAPPQQDAGCTAGPSAPWAAMGDVLLPSPVSIPT